MMLSRTFCIWSLLSVDLLVRGCALRFARVMCGTPLFMGHDTFESGFANTMDRELVTATRQWSAWDWRKD
jgi:hypothetical protein